MTRKLRFLGLTAAILMIGVTSQAVYANCQGEGPYELRQCGQSWFAPAPAGSGAVSTTWWAVGFGNSTAFQSATNAGQDGSGFLPTPLPGVFIGNDSGTLTTTELGLIPATPFGGPAGSLCFGAIANWGSPGIDGCGDANRNGTDGGGGVSISNNYLNPYWVAAYGPGTPYLSEQVDPPMGVLMTEATGTKFALAFFANRSRGGDPNDISPGEYNLAALANGDPSPSGTNAIPWQSVPEPDTATTLSDPQNTDSPRNVTMTWTPIRLVTDNSTRPCFQIDGTTPCSSLGGATGAGTNDQGALVHYEIESTPLSGGACGTSWALVPGSSVDHPANTSSISGIAPNTCLRLKTRFGKTPSAAFNPAATTGARDANRLAAQTGSLGDVGYSVASTVRRIGSSTVSQNAVLKVAAKNKNMVTVQWDTTSELNVTGFDIVGIDAKGNRKTVASSVACKACTNGLGASYTELVPSGKFEGSKKVVIVSRPSGDTSNTLDLN